MSDSIKNHAVIVGYARTPFAKAAIYGSGKPPGRLADVHPIEMQTPLVNKILSDTKLDPKYVTQIISGCVNQEGSQGLNMARLIVLDPNNALPQSVGGATVNMFCASSLYAIDMANGFVKDSPDDVYICTGIEKMSDTPMPGFNPDMNNPVLESGPMAFMNMPVTAENLAEKYGITRQEQDEFALRSHTLHMKAADSGRFKDEIVPIKGLDYDDGVRRDSSLEGLKKIRTAAKDEKEGGTVTAGTSSQITDGASAVMVTSEAFAQKNSLPVMARIIAIGKSGCAPEIMGIGPVDASKKALEKAGLKMSDIDVIELNEAFAAQALSVMKEWGKQGMAPDLDKVNVNGGAIAMGHPLGATGARIVGTLALELQKANKQYGMATLCVGGGQGMAMIIENPHFKP